MRARAHSLKRTVNVKAALILVLGGVALTAAVMSLHAFQVDRNSRELLAQADQAKAEGRAETEAHILGEYLGLNPSDAKAQARYGLVLKVLAKTALEYNNAYEALARARKLGDDSPEVRRALASLAVDLHKTDVAKELLEALLADNPDPKDAAELEELLGRCLEVDKDYKLAVTVLAKACEHDPKRIDAALRRAYLLRLPPLKLPADGDEAIEKMLDANADSRDARLGAAGYYAAFAGRDKALWAKAEEQFVQAQKLAANEAKDFLLGARIAQAQERLDEAARRLDKGLERHPKDPSLRLAKARLELGQGKVEKARETIKPLTESPPKKVGELVELANLLLDLGLDAEAGKVVDQLPPQLGPHVNYLRARLALKERKWGQARTYLEAALPYFAKMGLQPQGNLMLAQCCQNLSNPEGALEACGRALTDDPEWLPALQTKAAILLGQRRLAEAVPVYYKILPRRPDAALPLARALMDLQMVEDKTKRDWTAVEKVLQAMPKTAADNLQLQVLLLRADLEAARDHLPKARELLEQARKDFPKEAAPVMALAALAGREGKPEEAARALDQAEKALGPKAALIDSRIRLAIAKPAKEEALMALHALEGVVNDYPAAERAALRTLLADGYAVRGSPADARRLWDLLAKENPLDLNARLRLFDAAYATGDPDSRLESLVKEVRELEGPGGPYASWMDAARHAMLAREKELSDERKSDLLAAARKSLETAQKARPKWGPVLLLEAEILLLEKKAPEALKVLIKAIENGEYQPGVLKRVITDLVSRGQLEEVKKVLAKVPARALEGTGLDRLILQIDMVRGTGDKDKILEAAERLIPKDTKNYSDYLWLAMMSESAGKPAKAEAWLVKACDQAPTAPDAWTALVTFLAKTAPKKAEAALVQAGEKLTKADAPYVLAAGWETLKQRDKAEAQYKTLLKDHPDDPRILELTARFYTRNGLAKEAETYWRRLLDLEPKLEEPALAAVRRELAANLAGQGTADNLDKALKLVEQNLAGKARSADDERLKALIRANQPGGRADAIALLKKLHSAKALGAADGVRLAQLLEADNNWREAKKVLSDLTAADSKNPDPAAAYAQALLRHDEVQSAAPWVKVVKTAEPDSARAAALDVLLTHKERDTDAAVKKAQAFGRAKVEHLPLAANLLEQMKREEDAEQLWREYVTKSGKPESHLLLAQHLGRRKKVDEALAESAKAGKVSVAAAGATDIGILRNSVRPTRDQYELVAGRLEAAGRDNPKSVDLLVLRAELEDMRTHYADAIRLYSEALKLDPKNVAALNNLGWLLALTGKEEEANKAVELLDEAVKQAGEVGELLDTRGMAYLKAGKHDEAIKDLLKAVTEQPSVTGWYHLAAAYHQAGQDEEAIKTLAKANTPP